MQENKTLNLVRCAVFASVAVIIFAVESCIPIPVPIPGIKLGLANVVTLAAVYIMGKRQALSILLVRIILGNMLTGQMMSFAFSLCGGMLCYVATILLKPFFNQKNVWFLGMVGAVFHNIGQLCCAYFVLGSGSLLYYGLVLTAAACFTGSFTGLCAQYVIEFYKKQER